MGKIVCFAVLGVLLISSAAFSHSPADITTVINGTAIEITVEHSVSNPATHYVKKIVVKVNDEEVVSQTFTSQEGNYQKLAVDAPSMKKGDSVEVSAYCSKYGDRTETTQVP